MQYPNTKIDPTFDVRIGRCSNKNLHANNKFGKDFWIHAAEEFVRYYTAQAWRVLLKLVQEECKTDLFFLILDSRI